MRDIDSDAQINIIDRGNGSQIATFQEEGVHSLLSGNLMDVCPVGAITTRDYRFKSRPWDNPFAADTICTQCAKGCNVTAWIKAKPEWAKGSRLIRFTPRFNPEVNDYWMCDYGRASFERYKTVPRLNAPRLRDETGKVIPASWKDALDTVSRKLRSAHSDAAPVAFLGSGFLTSEEALLFADLADQVGTPHRAVAVDLGPERHIPNLLGGVTGREAAPNRRGAELAGLSSGSRGRSAAEILSGDHRFSVLVVTDSDFGQAAHDEAAVARLRQSAETLIVFGWADSALAQAADVALPLATHAEKTGSFVNVQGRVQRFKAAFPPPGLVRDGVDVLSDLLSRVDPSLANLTAEVVFGRLAEIVPAFAGLSLKNLPATGASLVNTTGLPAHEPVAEV
jgi:NADH-quinone oxidoreductase subunit G